MLGHAPSRPDNRPHETVTQRLERLRLEHRRHVRNTGNGTSRVSTRALVTPGPSLPDLNLPTGPNALDNWNDDRAGMAIRPRPVQALAPNAPLNLPPARDPVPVHGPPPPRSWVSPPSRNTGSTVSRISARKPHARNMTAKKVSKKAVPGLTVIERLRLEEEEALEKIYGDEYWVRPEGDVRWSAWREEALRLVFSYSVGSVDAGRPVLSESPFIPFEDQEGDSKVPTLFESVLKFIFAPSQDQHGERKHTEEPFNSLELLQALPPHIRKRALRYVAAHRPLTDVQLRRIHLRTDEEGLLEGDSSPMDRYEPTELVLSGRKIEAGLIGELLTSQENPIPTEEISPPAALLQSIVLFQTPFLQKRQLLSFPKTITTLGLIALPPPKGLWIHKIPTTSTTNTALPTIAGCSCPWCATAETEATTRTNSRWNRCSSSPSLPTLSAPVLPHTSSALIPQLVALPTILPSLVILDVSYNPWMSSDTVLRNSNQREINRSRKVERTEQVGQGILGTWDLRLWGRMKVLGIKGCFDHLSIRYAAERNHVVPPLNSEFDPLEEGGTTDLLRPAQSCAYGPPRGVRSEWRRRDALLEKWEKTAYAVGRSVEVVWREHGCGCGSSDLASNSSR